MNRTLTIRIKPVVKMLADFRDTFKAVEEGRKVTPRSGGYFTNIEAARNFFTRERLALLSAIRRERPGSISELARIVNRSLKSVQTDLKVLEKHGLVRFRPARRAARRASKAPEAPYREIALRIAI
ncbi:MAG: helix-turn-helix domain-containing protein [Acidobacteriia bacterium]|nr:helix-turn-helix domain-containing protein [Terriglobia bacterium]